MLKEIFDHIPVFTEQEKCCARLKSVLIYKNVQKNVPQCCKLLHGGNRIQNITQTLELFKAAEDNY